MIEIISPEKIVRETVKNVLEDEILLVNDEIRKASEDHKINCCIYTGISKATAMLLEDAGYDVKQDLYATNISWKSIYDEFMENYDKVKEITDEIGIKVIRAVENRNIFDPNWEPPRKD